MQTETMHASKQKGSKLQKLAAVEHRVSQVTASEREKERLRQR
jgi:hypothetical protein